MSFIINPYRYGASIPFSSVVLLTGFEGADASTTFTDESTYARTLTGNDNAQIDTAQFKFGSSSLLCAAQQDRVSAADSNDFEFGAGQFTVEAWVRWSSLSGTDGLVGKQSNSTSGPAWGLMKSSSHDLIFRTAATSSGGTVTDVTGTPSPALATGTWYHIAADRDAANDVRLYLNGVMLAKVNITTNFPQTTGAVQMGGISVGAINQQFTGWLDEVRIIKGAAAYASDAGFTPPTAAFPRS